MKILFDPAIIIIVAIFISILVYTYRSYTFVNSNLLTLFGILSKYKKSDISFRFGEFDSAMSKMQFISGLWHEFKSTLVFSESVAVKNQEKGVAYRNVSQNINSIQTTVDPLYFFDEDALVTSRYNSKFIAVAPTLLTGLGPLFTFLNVAIAFTRVDFATQESTISSVSSLMSSMQIAALCSVLAVSASLIYIFLDKIYYNKMCKLPLTKIQESISALFDSISSEKFLIELLKETKIQNGNLTGLLNALPNQISTEFDKCLSKSLIPYMENMLFGINNVNKSVKDINITLPKNGNSGEDVVDKLF